MKLVNLNIQCGVWYEAATKFIKTYSLETDIFCFQEMPNGLTNPRPVLGEVRENLFSEVQNILPDFASYYAASVENDVGGLAIFIKKSLAVIKVDNIVIFQEYNPDENDSGYFSMGKNVQVLEFKKEEEICTVLNFHGLWIPKNKSDTNKRIEQFKKVKKIFDASNGSKILCGDLNVNPSTESVSILSKGTRNLIQEYNITNTRSLSDSGYGQVADYIFTSEDIKINDFKVLPDEVSDHSPLFLDFNLK